MQGKASAWILIICLLLTTPAKAADITESATEVKLPILMYHCVSKNPSLQGKFGISPQALEADLAYLNKSGYKCIVFSDLVNYVNGCAELPEKPIMLTFDDGNFSDYNYLLPLLKKYDMKAVISVLGRETDKYSDDGRTDINYPNLTWGQINEMLDSGLVELQSHGYDLHGPNGALKKSGESSESYCKRFEDDLIKLQSRAIEMTGKAPTVFTYPKGKMSRESGDVLKKLGFLGSLGCEEGINDIEKGNPECLFKLKRYNRPSGTNIQELFEKIQKRM